MNGECGGDFMSQKRNVMNAINQKMENGMTDKQAIFSKVVEEMNVPRPTVRRCARDLKGELLSKIKVLNGDLPKNESEI